MSQTDGGGNFTLDQYLAMIDARSCSDAAAATDSDGRSVETNLSALTPSAAASASTDDNTNRDSAKQREKHVDAENIDDSPIDTYIDVTSANSAQHEGDDDSNKKKVESSTLVAPSIVTLSQDILLDILSFTTLPQRNRCIMTCRQMIKQQKAMDGKITSLCIDRHDLALLVDSLAVRLISASGANSCVITKIFAIIQSQRLQFTRLNGLRELNLSEKADDHVLHMISGRCYLRSPNTVGSMLLPGLEFLNVSGSRAVSEDALLLLCQKDNNDHYRTALKEVDATFCHKISYNAVIQYRELLPHCVLRRLPKCMTGRTTTPFGRGHGQVEIHTYWPCGTFSFDRATQSEGFVIRVDRLDQDSTESSVHLRDKLQFTNFEPPDSWPSWTRCAFRPGVSLLYDPENDIVEENDVISRNILVAQRNGGLRFPRYFPKTDHFHMVPQGESRRFALNGRLIDEENVENAQATVLVSQMMKRPLAKNEHFPPIDLVNRNKTFLVQYEEERELIPLFAEDMLHRALEGTAEGGDETDFRYEDGSAVVINRDNEE